MYQFYSQFHQKKDTSICFSYFNPNKYHTKFKHGYAFRGFMKGNINTLLITLFFLKFASFSRGRVRVFRIFNLIKRIYYPTKSLRNSVLHWHSYFRHQYLLLLIKTLVQIDESQYLMLICILTKSLLLSENAYKQDVCRAKCTFEIFQ